MSPQEFWRFFEAHKPQPTQPQGKLAGMSRDTFERLVANLHDPAWGKPNKEHASGRPQ
jgi:hypothetical protein